MDIFLCGRKSEPCASCGTLSIGNCQYPIKRIRRNGRLVDAPQGTVCGRPICRFCGIEVDGLLSCLAHSRQKAVES